MTTVANDSNATDRDDGRDWSWLARVNELALRDAAELYAHHGLYVFQLVPNGNSPVADSHGHLDATNDPDVVRVLWNEFPNRNVGINLERSGLYCVDVDPRNGGEPMDSWPDWKTEPLPLTWTETTPGGGWHHVFDASAVDGARFKKELWPGVDVKYNGFIAVAPSWRGLHQYRVSEARPPVRSSYVDGLVVRTRREPTSSSTTSTPVTPAETFDWSILREETIEPGQQDNTLQAAVGWLREFDAPDDFALPLLYSLMDRFENQPGKREWTQADVDSKWERAKESYEPNQRRRADELGPGQLAFVDSMSRAATGDALPDGFLSLDDVDAWASDDYVVKHLLDRPSVAFLHGDPKVGKSFIALDLAIRVALGLEWCGRRVRPTSVLYVYSEGGSRLWRRRNAWRARYGELDVEDQLIIYPRPIKLVGAEEPVRALLEWARERAFGMVVFDTWATATAGGNENAAGEVGTALERAGWFRDDLGAAVLFVHHDGKSGGYRGSTAIDGYGDTRIHATRTDDGAIQLVTESQRDHLESTWYGRLETQDWGALDSDGDPVTSAAFVYEPNYEPPRTGGGTDRFVREQRVQLGVLEVLRVVRDRPGCTGNWIRQRVDGGVTTVNGYLAEAVELGLIRVSAGTNKSKIHTVTELGLTRLE